MRKKWTLAFIFAIMCVGIALGKPIKGVKHVVLIGSDGFSAEIIKENPGLFTSIEQIMKMGSSTLEARSVLPSSSAVNWASMLMGAGPELHGFTQWGSQKPDLPSRILNEWNLFPSIIGETRKEYPNAIIAAGYAWDGIGYLYEQKAVTHNVFTEKDAELCDKMCDIIAKDQPLLTFISFGDPDHVGHSKGWGSNEYREVCKAIDSYVGKIVQTIEKSGMDKNTVVIFTADHGGLPNGQHGGKTMKEMQVPFAIKGKAIRENYAIKRSFMMYDTAATVAFILGIKQPDVWVGRMPKEILK